MLVPIIISCAQALTPHVIGDDPYEFLELSTDQLIGVYFECRNGKGNCTPVVNEMKARLLGDPSRDDEEILTKTLMNEP